MLSDYQLLVPNLVRDDAGKLSTDDIDQAIQLAVERYSKDAPLELAEDLTPTDANTLPLPDSWHTDFSTLLSLEYPIGNVPPTLIDPERRGFYRSPSGVVIQLLDAVAIAAANVRALYTIKHTVSDADDTIAPHAREPVACWAGALLCDQLAAFYSGGTDSTIQADSVESRSKAQEYSSRGKSLRKRYTDELGLDDKRAAPAGVVVNLDQASTQNQDRLTHPRMFR